MKFKSLKKNKLRICHTQLQYRVINKLDSHNAGMF